MESSQYGDNTCATLQHIKKWEIYYKEKKGPLITFHSGEGGGNKNNYALLLFHWAYDTLTWILQVIFIPVIFTSNFYIFITNYITSYMFINTVEYKTEKTGDICTQSQVKTSDGWALKSFVNVSI